MIILPAALLVKIGIGAVAFVGLSLTYALVVDPDMGDLSGEKKRAKK